MNRELWFHRNLPLEREAFSGERMSRDIPEDNLQAGDIGTVVEEHQVEGQETGYSLEFFDLLGHTVAVVTVPQNWLQNSIYSLA